jgi:hypothetical protein
VGWCFASGVAISYFVSGVHKLETYKLLNIAGILYGLLAVLILSELVVENARWSLFVAETISDLSIKAHMAFPLGAAMMAGLLTILAPNSHPSSVSVLTASMIFLVFALPEAFLVEDFVWAPKLNISKKPKVRSRRFGLILGVTGMIVQLIAAVQDVLQS